MTLEGQKGNSVKRNFPPTSNWPTCHEVVAECKQQVHLTGSSKTERLNLKPVILYHPTKDRIDMVGRVMSPRSRLLRTHNCVDSLYQSENERHQRSDARRRNLTQKNRSPDNIRKVSEAMKTPREEQRREEGQHVPAKQRPGPRDPSSAAHWRS